MLARLTGKLDVNEILDRCSEEGAGENCAMLISEFTRNIAEAQFWLSAARLIDLAIFFVAAVFFVFVVWPLAKDLVMKSISYFAMWKRRLL